MKLLIFTVLNLLCISSSAQTQKDHIEELTSKLSQTWELDSIAVRDGYNRNYDFVKGTKLVFKAKDNTVSIQPNAQSQTNHKWRVYVREPAAELEIEGKGDYEISFKKINGVEYLRIRDAIRALKNTYVTEYYFTKSN